MKKLKRYLPVLLLAACWGCSMASSEDLSSPMSGDSGVYTAIVSVKVSPTDTVYFQADEQTRLFPMWDRDAYRGLERIVCGVRIFKETVPNYGYLTDVLWYDSLDKGTTTSSASVVGDDPVEVLSDWRTSCEDGYLTLHYEAWWGEGSLPHAFYLVTGLNPDDPYEVWLRHDAKGDGRKKKADSLVYFDLQSLPDPGNGSVTLTLKWKNGEGKTLDKPFTFKSRGTE